MFRIFFLMCCWCRHSCLSIWNRFCILLRYFIKRSTCGQNFLLKTEGENINFKKHQCKCGLGLNWNTFQWFYYCLREVLWSRQRGFAEFSQDFKRFSMTSTWQSLHYNQHIWSGVVHYSLKWSEGRSTHIQIQLKERESRKSTILKLWQQLDNFFKT